MRGVIAPNAAREPPQRSTARWSTPDRGPCQYDAVHERAPRAESRCAPAVALMRLPTAYVLITPHLLALAVVVDVFNRHAAPPEFIARPVVALIVCAAIVEIVVLAVTQRAVMAAVISGMGVLLVTGSQALGIAIAVVVGWLMWIGWHALRGRPAPAIEGVVAALAVIYVGSSVGTAVMSGAFSLRDVGRGSTGFVSREEAAPSIYVLLLDAYPRADTLATEWGFDNSFFLDALGGMGFDVYADARTDHSSTPLTLLAMVSGDTDGFPPSVIDNPSYREARRRFPDAVGIDVLHEAGYELVTIRSPVDLAAVHGLDRTIDTGQMNGLELTLVQQSPFHELAGDWVMDQLRERVIESLAALEAVADPERQRAVLAHVLAPHPPFLWDADGHELAPPPCWPACHLFAATADAWGLTDAEFGQRWVEQITHVNSLVLRHVSTIVRTDPGAVVVVMSDHGARLDFTTPDAEHFRNLMAVRSPGRPSVFRSEPTPTDLFVRLVQAYDR